MIVVCFLWNDRGYRYGARYTAEHVNRLGRMLDRHLPGCELVCVTDIPEGIDPAVRIVPLWDDHRKIGGCYVRLKMFAEEMREVIGERFVLMDLDCVITGPLAPLFDTDEDFVVWRSHHLHTEYNAGFYLLRAGARREVWDTFEPPESLRQIALTRYIGWDQAWLNCVVSGERTWGPEHGVYNFRYDIADHGGHLPEDARVVFFPGDYDPSSPSLRQRFPWIEEHWQ